MMKKKLLLLMALMFAGASVWAQATIVGGATYPTIQAAITAADAGDIIEVAAGIYAENLQITENVNLKSTTLHAAIIQTQAGFNAGNGYGGITFLADGATLDGFKIEQNVNQAIIHTHNANNVSIVNNWIIGISPAAPRGVDAGYGSANSDGVVIEGNKFEDLYCGVYINQATDLSIDANDFVADMGDGAIVFDGTWNFSNIDVINNTATDANYLMFYYGSQGSVTYSGNTLNSTLLSNWKVFNVNKGNFYQTIQAAIVAASAADVIQVAAGTFTETISVNKSLIINGPNIGVDPNGAAPRLDEAVLLDGKLQVSGANTIVIDGIKVRQTNDFLDALLLGGSSVVTLQNSIIERFGVNTGVGARGLTTAAGPGLKTIQNNLFTGDLSGGLYSGHKTWNSGMYVNGGSSTLNILNNVFENCRTAINLDDYNTNIALSGNTFQNSGTLLSFGGTTPTDGSYILGVNDFNPIGAFINLSNVAETFRLDITSSTVIGVPFSSISLATLFDIEATMYHRSRSSRKGLVYYVADHVFVRSDINSSIKTAIAYAAAGDIVNVAPGAYTEAVVLNKAVTLKGANAGVAAGNNPGSRSTETVLDGGFYVTAAATIDGFKIINGSSSGSILNCVTAAVSGITVQNSILQDVAGNQNNGIETIGGANNLTLTNNTITNNWRGIYLNPSSGHILTGNLIDANNGVGVGIGSDGLSNFTMTKNTISNHTLEGWGASSVGANVIANNNILVNNLVSVAHYSGSQIDANCNWWGTIDGITISSLISGDVVYAPYLLTDDIINPVCGHGGSQAYNAETGIYYQFAQDAIDDASEGDEIEIYYDPAEELDVNMELNIHYIFNEP